MNIACNEYILASLLCKMKLLHDSKHIIYYFPVA